MKLQLSWRWCRWETLPLSFTQKHTVHMWTQETVSLQCPYTRWGGYTAKKWTNYSEWHWKTDCVIRFQFKLVLSFQRRTKIKLWQWCVLTSPKRNLCLSVCAHLCVRVSLRAHVCVHMVVCVCVYGVYSFGGESLSSGGPGWLPFTLPTPTDLCLHTLSIPRFLPSISLCRHEKTHWILQKHQHFRN